MTPDTMTRDGLRESLLAATRDSVEAMVERLVREGCVPREALPSVVDALMVHPAVREACESPLDAILADLRSTAPR